MSAPSQSSQPQHSRQHFEQARAEYHEYFAIKEPLAINVVPLPSQGDHKPQVPSEESFLAALPAVFQMAGELQQHEQPTTQQIRALGDAGHAILELFQQQNQKLNALLGYLLRYEDDPEDRYQGFEYGGAGVGFHSPKPFSLGQLVELKLFLNAESAALYCIGEVIDCEDAEPGYRVRVLFRRIREADQELMVRAALHAQTRLLKKRASERTNEP